MENTLNLGLFVIYKIVRKKRRKYSNIFGEYAEVVKRIWWIRYLGEFRPKPI